MKKVILLLMLFFAVSFPINGNAVESTEKCAKVISDDFIYVKVKMDGKIIVFVYLSDGVTLVNIYEEED